MQRKAIKQFNKVTQWTNEKVFSAEKTQLSEEFLEFDQKVEPGRKGLERLQATAVPFYEQLTKVKPSADPYRSGSKDKMSPGEALGLVMIDYGGEVAGEHGDGLVKYGRARTKIAILQEQFGHSLHDGFIETTKASLASVNDYKHWSSKMESRRLTLDGAQSRLKQTKKDTTALEQEVDEARMRLDEAKDETTVRMQSIEEQEVEQFKALEALVTAELEYYSQCTAILEELRSGFPTASTTRSHKPAATTTETRARARSNASARSAGHGAFSRAASDEEDNSAASGRKSATGNRSRSGSTVSLTKGKGRSIISSIGKTATMKMFRTNRGDTLMSEDEVDENSQATSAPSRPNNRARSQSVASVVTGPGLGSDVHAAPRRAITSPSSPAPHLVKARYDFEATDTGDLPLRKGQIVEITEEVSEEWARGKSEGESGIFPLEYTEPYTAPAPPAPAPSIRRMLPHPGAPPSVSTDEDTDADDVESTQSDDHDDSVALASAAQPTPTARSRASSVGRKLPPPPPPSRRTPGARPPPPLSRSRSGTVTAVPSASPFAHSDDSPIFAQSLASLQIRNGYDTVDLSDPCDCGCDQFAQNQYKPQGHCARCYHQH